MEMIRTDRLVRLGYKVCNVIGGVVVVFRQYSIGDCEVFSEPRFVTPTLHLPLG